MRLTPKAGGDVQHGAVLTLSCDLDCAYAAQLYRMPGKLLATARGMRDRRTSGRADAARVRVEAGVVPAADLAAVARVNPGRSALLARPRPPRLAFAS